MPRPAAGWRFRSFFAPWLFSYEIAWLRPDLVAGVTLAAYSIPVSMAYSSLAGLPPQHGIYCYLLGGVAYALLGTCRQLAIGPTSAIALLVGATVGPMAAGDAERAVSIAALAALAVGVVSALAWALHLSGLVSFISETILLGFKAGAALTIAMTQLPKLFAVPGGGDSFFERAATLFGQFGDTNLLVLGFGLAALAVLIVGERILPGRPIALFVVVLATVVVSCTSVADHGVATVGDLPRGLPAVTLPALGFRDVDGIVPLALACFLLSYIEGISAARTLAARHETSVDPRQELLALGAANAAVALVQGFPVAGGLSQSAVNDKAGAKTPLALLIASATLAVCLLFLTDSLANLPTVVLASIVLVAVSGLIDIAALRYLWSVSRTEFQIAMIAMLGVLLFGILKGVLLAAIASILFLLAGTAHPHVAFLGRIPGTRKFSDLERHPDNETIPSVLIFRVEAALLYFNIDHVRPIVGERILATPNLRLVICDLSDTPMVDLAGGRFLDELRRDLVKRNAHLRLIGGHAKIRDLLRALGLEKQVGYFGRRISLDEAIDEFEADRTQVRVENQRPNQESK